MSYHGILYLGNLFFFYIRHAPVSQGEPSDMTSTTMLSLRLLILSRVSIIWARPILLVCPSESEQEISTLLLSLSVLVSLAFGRITSACFYMEDSRRDRITGKGVCIRVCFFCFVYHLILILC